MNKKHLGDHIKDHYSRQALPPETVARLLAQNTVGEKARPVGFFGHRLRVLGAAAVIVVTVLSVPFMARDTAEDDQWTLRAAQEVALNHKKQLAAEFLGADYDSLRLQMGKLDFVLTAPARLRESRLRLVGARYCSIQGHLAAQIRLKDDQGHEYTLYQTHLPSPTVAFSASDYRVDGIRIQEWREAGLFFALATSK